VSPRFSLRRRAARLSSAARDLAGKSGPALIEILVAHLACAREGAAFAEEVLGGTVPAEEVEARMVTIERRGDALRRDLVAALGETIVTPLDREDLFRLSRSIDDVLDNTRDFVREWMLYAPEQPGQLANLLATLTEGLASLERAVAALVEHPEDVVANLLSAKQQANGVRRHFQVELAKLFAGELSMETLKERELIRRLDVVGLRFGEAVDVCSDALVKRGRRYVLNRET
jgi:hypothetical protein